MSELDYLYKTLAETSSSADYLYQTSKVYKSAVAYPNSEFGRNLKTTAELINSGVGSRVFYVSLTGFDTHVRQQEQQGKLLGDLSEGLGSFCRGPAESRQFRRYAGAGVFRVWPPREPERQQRHRPRHRQQRAAAGRRPQADRASSTTPPTCRTSLDGDLRHQLDFRSLYATVLHDWLEADDKAILGNQFERLKGLV